MRGMNLIIAVLIIAAGIFALAVLLGVAIGTLTAHLIPLAVLFLAIALALAIWGNHIPGRL